MVLHDVQTIFPISAVKPPIPYMGGKSRIVHWLLRHVPEHTRYIEPFGGAGALLFRKFPAPVEIYSDVDGDLVNLMRVLKDRRQAKRLMALLDDTPLTAESYLEARHAAHDPVERARRFYVRKKMSVNACEEANSAVPWRLLVDPHFCFRTYLKTFPLVTERLQTVEIEQASFERLLFRYDLPGTLFYLDPPYLGRKAGLYRHEMSRADHFFLLECVLRLKHARVMLSGYFHESYREMLTGWKAERLRVACHASWSRGGKPKATRLEYLWMNYEPK